TEMFGEELERSARQSIRQPLPVYSSAASDSREQITANKMLAAAEAVNMLAKDLHLDSELVALFAKAGTPQHTISSNGGPAHIGPSPSVQAVYPGTLQGALVGVNPPPSPETAKA